jgi:hypothetical protein
METVDIVEHMLDNMRTDTYALEMLPLYGMYAVPFDKLSVELLNRLFTSNEYIRAWMLMVLGMCYGYEYIEGTVNSVGWRSDIPVVFIKANIGIVTGDTLFDDFKPRRIVGNDIVKIVNNVVNNKQ